MTPPRRIFLACPSYTAGTVNQKAQILAMTKHPGWVWQHMEMCSSLLTWSFNSCWAQALNLRERGGITHFLMLHADVNPRGGAEWVDQLLAEMEASQAQVLSGIIPIKSARGLTSTALETDNRWRPRRLTMAEVHARPVTWTDPALLFNTGLLLVDFSDPWVERVCFTMRDLIEKEPDGIWRASVEPEDWHFSRQCRALGVRVAVTRRVAVDHCGFGYWSSDQVWGQATDDGPHPTSGGVGAQVGRPVASPRPDLLGAV